MAAVTPDTLKFELDGNTYQIPPLDDMDMDEWQIIYDYSGLVLEDFAPAPDRAAETEDGQKPEGAEDGPLEKERQHKVAAPAFTTALLHIGYRRAHPDAKHDTIRKLVGSTKRLHVLEAMADAVGEGEAPTPLESTPEPAPSSPGGKGTSSEPSSPVSPTVSGAPGLYRVPTGTSA